MPVQTNKKANIFFPDGAKVLVKTAADSDWTDVGAINSSVTATLNWTESSVETANAGKLNTRVSNMEIAGGFTLINLDVDAVQKMGGGVFTVASSEGGSKTLAAQVIASPVANKKYTLEYKDSAGKSYALPSFPSSATVNQGDTSVTNYAIVDGCIVFGAAPGGDVTISYPSEVTVIGRKTLYCGSSTVVMEPYAMRVEHKDDAGKVRALDLFSVYSGTGGFQFNFKGANEDGVEEMPITFTARLDSNLTSGRQLMAWSIDTGAM